MTPRTTDVAIADRVARIAALDGERLRRVLIGQMRRPDLERVTIVSYRYNDFDPEVGGFARHQLRGLIGILERALVHGVGLTFVTRDPLTDASSQMSESSFRSWHEGLGRLVRGGASIKLHQSLHAKVYLLEIAGGWKFYAVGSSNLTSQGMGFQWAECNVRGYHPADWDIVNNQIARLLSNPRIESFGDWERRVRTNPRYGFLFRRTR
jgi:hypothetical protein